MGKTVAERCKEMWEGKRMKDENGEEYTIRNIRCTPRHFGDVKKVLYTAEYHNRTVNVMNLGTAFLEEHREAD